jgi:hypothetical protein
MKCKCHRNSGRQHKSDRTGKIVPVKEVGASCRYKNACWNRLKDSAESVFHSFWDLADSNSQNSYLMSNMKMQEVQRRNTLVINIESESYLL